MRVNKNHINDYIIMYENGLLKWYELLQLIEYKVGLRNAIVLLNGEEEDGSFIEYIINNLEDYILIKEGVIVVSNDLNNANKLLEIKGDNDKKLGLALGYPRCCVERWISLKNCEETAIHTNNMKNFFKCLSYVPCCPECKQSIEREKRIQKIIYGDELT